MGLLVLERLLLCRNIGSTEGDLASRECKRHQKKSNTVGMFVWGKGRGILNLEPLSYIRIRFKLRRRVIFPLT